MTRDEKQDIMRRYSQMHTHYLRLISSDPDNARYYKIIVDHYRQQYCALGKSKKEKDTSSSENDNIFTAPS